MDPVDPQWERWRLWLARHPDLDGAFGRMVDADRSGGWFMANQAMGDEAIWSSEGPDIPVARSSSSLLNDLHDQGLVRVARYDRNGWAQYELPADARDFERWRRGLPSPAEQVETDVLRVVDDAGFAERHPDAAKHLRAAFELLAAFPLDLPDTRIFGEHLRKALIDVAGAAAGLPASDEDLQRVFKPVRQSAARRADVAVAMLVDLCRAVLSLNHGVEHVSDELTDRRVPAGPETLRRAAFLTAVCCYELDRVPLVDAAAADAAAEDGDGGARGASGLGR